MKTNRQAKQLFWCIESCNYVQIKGDYIPGEPISSEQFECSGAIKENGSVKCKKGDCELFNCLSVPYIDRLEL